MPHKIKTGYKDFEKYYEKSDYGYFTAEIRSALKKCWLGYMISKAENDRHMMIYYAAGITKFLKQLNMPVCDFLDLDMMSEFERADFAKLCESERIGTEELTQRKAEEDKKKEEEERWERSLRQWRPDLDQR